MVKDVSDDGETKPNDERHEANQPIPVIINNRKTTLKQSERSQTKRNLKTVKRSNKLIQALNLPSVMNVNPRSIYNKAKEFHNFVMGS